MNNQAIKSYVEGFVPDEDQACHILVAEGPQIVVPTLRLVLPILKPWGEQLAILLVKPSEDKEIKVIVERKVGLYIDNIFFRVQRLMRDIASSSSQHGKMVGEQMRLALTDTDEDLHVLATVHSIAEGIPSQIVSGSLVRLLHDNDPLTRYGAATAMLGLPDIPDPDNAKPVAVALVKLFLEDAAFPSFPLLADKIWSHFGQAEAYKIMVFAILAVYRLLAIRLFDKESGSVSASLSHSLGYS